MMHKESFGQLPNGEQAFLYVIASGKLVAHITDFGATLVRLYVPDAEGNLADVVLGYEDAESYRVNSGYLGTTVGRNANRIKNSRFPMNGRTIQLPSNELTHNLHSGPESFSTRLWTVERYEENLIAFSLMSPDGDQGFPGNAEIRVTYELRGGDALCITYDAICDKDTVFNMTNHSYFNLAGHNHPELAMGQTLCMPARFFNPDDAESIPTGELRSVEGTPMDFREPKPVGAEVEQDYECLNLQGGYDHNFEVFCNPCAILSDPVSGRSMAVVTDCPGLQVYSGNYLDGVLGKDGVYYTKRGGIALETQYYPDSVNHPEWPQPFIKAGERYHSETKYIFK